MRWRRCVAVSGLALALIGVWSSVHAQSGGSPPTGDVPDSNAGAASAGGGGAAGRATVGGGARTSTRVKPQRVLPASVDAGVEGTRTPADAGVDGQAALGPLPPDNEPPPGDLPPANEIPPAPEKVTVSKSALPPGMRAYGRKDPLMPHVRLDGHVALTWDGSFGVGARADWLLIEGTFKYSQRDELAISAGCDITFVRFDGTQVVEAFPTVVLQWSIGVDDRLFLYPEFGVLGHVDDGRWDGLYPNLGFGTRYYLHRSIGIQGRFGWPIAFSAGAVF